MSGHHHKPADALRIFQEYDLWQSRPGSMVWACVDCSGEHPVPRVGWALVCPNLTPGKARPRAVNRVEVRIAKARGQYLEIEQEMHWDTVDEIVAWEKDHPGWGRELRRHYLSDSVLGPYLFMLATVDPLKDAAPGHNRQPTNEDRALIFNHLPLIRKLAANRATTITADGMSMNEEVFSQLEAIGLDEIEELAVKFDPTRGVPFEAFAKKRLGGAMDNWLVRDRVKTAATNKVARSIWWGEANPDAPKRHRTSTGGYRARSYIETAARPVRAPDGLSSSRLLPASLTVGAAIEAALARLTERQRVVYRGRTLADPPVARAELARQIGVDERQIPRIQKQADRRMRKFLAEN